jgi:hypothetical protein
VNAPPVVSKKEADDIEPIASGRTPRLLSVDQDSAIIRDAATRAATKYCPPQNGAGFAMRRLLVYLCILLSVPVFSPAYAYDDLVLPSVDFAATAVHEAGPIKTTEAIYYANGKLRIDRGKGFSSTILDLRTQTECLLMVNHTYLVMPMDDELFRRYIARNVNASGSRKLGTERIEGLKTTKYAFGNDGELAAAGSYWLTSTGIMVRREYNDGVFGKDTHHLQFMTHITLGKQPAELFEIPAGYKPAT